MTFASLTRWLCASLILFGAVWAYTRQSATPPTTSGAAPSVLRSLTQQQLALHLDDRDLVLLHKNRVLLEQHITADLYLRPLPQRWQGQLRHVQIRLQGELIEIAEPIYFEIDYQQGAFGAIDWLGLPTDHPMRRLQLWMQQLSLPDTTQTLHMNNQQLGFRYSHVGPWGQRQLLQQSNLAPDGAWRHHLEQDDWRLLLDAQQRPVQLDSLSQWRISKEQAAPLLRLQQLTVSTTTKRPSWPATAFPATLNQGHHLEAALLLHFQQLSDIVFELQQSQTTPWPYATLPPSRQLDRISALLQRYPSDSSALAHFINALPSDTRQQWLQQLAVRPCSERMKLFLLQQLASVAAPERATLDLLQQTIRSGNLHLQQQALTSLAQLLRNQPTLHATIEPNFDYALAHHADTAFVLQTIASSGSNNFTRHALRYSQDPRLAVRQSAFLLLAHSNKNEPAGGHSGK